MQSKILIFLKIIIPFQKFERNVKNLFQNWKSPIRIFVLIPATKSTVELRLVHFTILTVDSDLISLLEHKNIIHNYSRIKSKKNKLCKQ